MAFGVTKVKSFSDLQRKIRNAHIHSGCSWRHICELSHQLYFLSDSTNPLEKPFRFSEPCLQPCLTVRCARLHEVLPHRCITSSQIARKQVKHDKNSLKDWFNPQVYVTIMLLYVLSPPGSLFVLPLFFFCSKFCLFQRFCYWVMDKFHYGFPLSS